MIVWALCPTCCSYPACLPPSTKSAARWDTPALEVTTPPELRGPHPPPPTRGPSHPASKLNAPVLFCHSRVVREDDGLSAGLQCPWKVHGGKRWVHTAHPSGRLCPSEGSHKPLHSVQDAHEAHLEPEAMDAHLPRWWGDAVSENTPLRSRSVDVKHYNSATPQTVVLKTGLTGRSGHYWKFLDRESLCLRYPSRRPLSLPHRHKDPDSWWVPSSTGKHTPVHLRDGNRRL